MAIKGISQLIEGFYYGFRRKMDKYLKNPSLNEAQWPVKEKM